MPLAHGAQFEFQPDPEKAVVLEGEDTRTMETEQVRSSNSSRALGNEKRVCVCVSMCVSMCV